MLLLVMSCTNPSSDTENLSFEEMQEMREEILESTKIYFHQSEKIPDSDFYIYPVSTSVEDRGARYYSKGGYENKTWNIVFFNIKTKEKHLLFDSITPIIRDYPNESDFEYLDEFAIQKIQKQKRKSGKLFFELILEDSNENGKIDEEDANGLFISELDGSNLTRLSPKELDLTSWKFLDQNKTIIELICIENIDDDKRYTSGDKEQILIASLDTSHFELFDHNYREKLKEQYIK